jgi:hypothetical protein
VVAVAVYSDAALRVPVYSVGALSVYRVGAHFDLHGLQCRRTKGPVCSDGALTTKFSL